MGTDLEKRQLHQPEILETGRRRKSAGKPKKPIARAIWNAVASFMPPNSPDAGAFVLQADGRDWLPLYTLTGRLVCRSDLPGRARRSFAGVAVPKAV